MIFIVFIDCKYLFTYLPMDTGGSQLLAAVNTAATCMWSTSASLSIFRDFRQIRNMGEPDLTEFLTLNL